MVDFPMPVVSNRLDGWGPPPDSEASVSFGICDFVEHLEKFPTHRIGRVCDFTAAGQRYQAERASKGKGFKGAGKGKGLLPNPADKDEQGFSIVDSRPMPGKSGSKGKGAFGRSKGRGKGLPSNYQEGILGQKQKPTFQTNQPMGKGGKSKGKGKGGQQRRGLPSYKEWSVQTKTEWNIMRDIQLTHFTNLRIDAKEVQYEDLLWCGKLHTYSRAFDRVTVKTEKSMRRFEELNFFNVSTSDDPLLPEYLQSNPEVNVIATDHVLACLMCAARSVYSWDILVTKIADKLIFDKRDGSQVDFLSVNETAHEPPNNDDTTSINSPIKLGQEASCINQNFSQMVLEHDIEAEDMERPNPFDEDEEGSVASGAYRYRKITLPGNPKAEDDFATRPVSLIVRTEVNCKLPGSDELVSVKALNEYDHKSTDWRRKLETQRGACMANEIKNNTFKLHRWTAQAILAGCSTLKVGWISRINQTDPWTHSLLNVHTHNIQNFASTVGLAPNNMFGVLRTIIDTVMTWPDGKYLLLKDPTKPLVRFYEVPWETFGEEEEAEVEDDEEEQELDEDGNVAPPRPI
jgi:translation initiation factor 3 subunit D